MKYDTWNNWSDKSYHVPFKSDNKSIGNGEQKLACELNTIIQGQNQSFDMKVDGEEIECKCLDHQNSFRIGVKMNSLCTEITLHLISICEILFEIIKEIQNVSSSYTRIVMDVYESIFQCKKSGRNKYSIYEGLKKHELCASNLLILSENIEILKKLCLEESVCMISIFHPINGKSIFINIEKAYGIYNTISNDKNYFTQFFTNNDDYVLAIIRYYLRDKMKIFAISSLKDRLNCIVRGYFANIRLIIVDEKNGYMPIQDLSRISCIRITSGNPRGYIHYS